MENFRFVTSVKFILIGGTLLVFPLFGFAYSDQTTHPALTQEIVKFFNKSFPEITINDKNAELIIQGSIDEDSGIRWMRHFYDPVYNRGLTLSTKEQQLAVISAALGDQTGKSGSWPSAKNWALNTSLQGGFTNNLSAGIFKNYFSSNNDYSWDRAIYEYAWGNKDRGLTGLGHILHLLEDMTVPDHTRNDPHPPVLDMGSPYESWTTKFNRQNININPNKKLVILSNLNNYFDNIANYSNNNFFSKDTILDKSFNLPVISYYANEILSNGLSYTFAYSKDNYKLFRADKISSWKEITESTTNNKLYLQDNDNSILTDYWSLLSKQAVLHGAGVINLFFAEVEKEKQSKILYEKNRSWLNKQIDKFKSGVLQIANIFYGITVTEKDLKEEAPAPPQKPELKAAVVEFLPPQTPKPEPELTPRLAETVIISTPASTPITPAPAPALTSASNIPQNTIPEISTTPPKSTALITSENNNYSSGWSYAYSQTPSTPAPTPTPTPTPTPPPLPPPDTTPPAIFFTIPECGQSLSSSTCLLATTTINLFWLSTSTDLARYGLTCETNNSACPNFNFASTTATSTIYNLADNSSYIFKAWAIDNAENQSTQQIITVAVALRFLVINEIGWMGTSPTKTQDEWLEIFNPTFHSINLSGIALVSDDVGPNIQLSGTIAPRGFYLIERTDDTTISNLIASSTGSFGNGLNNNGEVLALKYGSTTIDRTPAVNPCGGWCGGLGNPQFLAMERYDPLSSGEDQNNWGSWMNPLPANGKNANGLPINGTPGRRNSINYLIDKSVSSLNQNKTLKKIDSPYLVPSPPFAIQSGATLTIEPGVVIKLYNGATLAANGIIKAEGTAADPIIFTSIKDDFYGGDTNQDSASTTPAPGDWGSIKIFGNGSVLDRTIIRYGGLNDFSASQWANLKIENAQFTLKNSIIEESGVYGIWLINSSGTIEGNTIRNNKQGVSGVGLTAQDGSLNITNNTFTNNIFGLQLTSVGATNNFTVNNNNFSQNSQYAIQVVSAYPTFSGNTAVNNGLNGINLQGVVNQDYTIFPDLPYIIENTTYFTPAGKTLTILPGTIFKLKGGSIAISGKLLANGTASNKIIFTSINDDDCGIPGGCGDTNATTTPPAAGDWNNLSFLSGSASSTLKHIAIRYGGVKSPSGPLGALRIKDSSIDVKNTDLENNYWVGAWLENSTSTSIIGSIFKNHLEPPSENATGLYLASSSPFIQNTAFENNKTGIQADGLSSVNNGGGIIFSGNTTNTIPTGLIP